MSRRFPKEFKAWMLEYIPGHTAVEISAEAMQRFGIEITPKQVKSFKQNNGAPSGTRCGVPVGYSKLYSAEVLDWIKNNRYGKSIDALAAEVNERFGTGYSSSQIRGLLKNRKWGTGVDCRFKAGVPSWSTGKKLGTHGRTGETQFHAGHEPHNILPVGTTVTRTDGYLWTKIAEPDVWRFTHILNWEAEHGPLPEGQKLIFLDGNKLNTAADNLMPVSNAENLEMLRSGLRFDNADITRAGANIAKVKVSVRKARKCGR